MRPVSLNFAPKRHSYWSFALLLLATGVTGTVWHEYEQLTEQAEGLSTADTNRDAQVKARSAAIAVPGDLDLRIGRAQKILAHLGIPWTALFNELEAVSADGVTLVDLQPDADQGSISVTAEARDIAAMLTYVARLEDTKEFSRVHLVRHEVLDAEPGHPVRFSVSAAWKAIS